MPLAVLCPGGRDPLQTFPSGAGSPRDSGHPPVNYHAYAACSRGGYFRDSREVPETASAVLVLLRKNWLKMAHLLIPMLKKKGCKVLISWKESGLHQVAQALDDAKRYEYFQLIGREADAFLSSTPEMVTLYQQAGCGRGEYIPTPYAVDVPAWDFSAPFEERRGIFIGTRELDVPSRNHFLAVMAASALGFPVTVVNADGRKAEKVLRMISPDLNIVSGPMPYADYLRLMARHRVVFQLDRSAVPGQVAGDALLCRLISVGGDGATDRVAFPEFAGGRFSLPELTELVVRLMTDNDFYRRSVMASQAKAQAELSFESVRLRLSTLIESIPAREKIEG